MASNLEKGTRNSLWALNRPIAATLGVLTIVVWAWMLWAQRGKKRVVASS